MRNDVIEPTASVVVGAALSVVTGRVPRRGFPWSGSCFLWRGRRVRCRGGAPVQGTGRARLAELGG